MTVKWIETTIGQQATLQRGFDITKVEQSSGNVAVISSSGVSSYHDTPAVKGPGVVLGRKGVLGSVFYVQDDFWPHDTTLWVKDFHDNDPRFVYYFFQKWSQDFLRMDVGSANPTLNRNHVHPIKVLWPPKIEQGVIAAILGTLDDKIELNRRMNETLEAMARAIFKSWFVDFDPVRAKAEGRQPFGMDVETAALFPDSFEDSTLGKIPEGWTVKELGNVADVNWGDTKVTKRAYTPKGFLAFSASGPDGFLSYFDYNRVGIVVSAIGAESGLTWLANGKWSCIKNTIRFWATAPDISTEYLFQATWGKEKWPLRGSAQPFISQGDTRRMEILVPANGLAVSYGKTVAPLYSRIETNNQESSTLSGIRDTLLPKLISGEIRVKDVEGLTLT